VTLLTSAVDRLEVVAGHEFGDVPAERPSLHIRRTEVEAGPNARLDEEQMPNYLAATEELVSEFG
jgi:hypothetical protein